MNSKIVGEKGEILIPDPKVAFVLFQTVRVAWLWVLLRLFLAATWIPAGWGKMNNPKWMSGQAIEGFWSNAVSVETGNITYEWYRSLLQFMIDAGWSSWFGPLMAYAELATGILLLLGAFTGIAAFAGGFLNLNFMLAGVASSNPLMFLFSILLILAWKVAGWYGLDRWLLPRLGTPWMHSASRDVEPVAQLAPAD